MGKRQEHKKQRFKLCSAAHVFLKNQLTATNLALLILKPFFKAFSEQIPHSKWWLIFRNTEAKWYKGLVSCRTLGSSLTLRRWTSTNGLFVFRLLHAPYGMSPSSERAAAPLSSRPDSRSSHTSLKTWVSFTQFSIDPKHCTVCRKDIFDEKKIIEIITKDKGCDAQLIF